MKFSTALAALAATTGALAQYKRSDGNYVSVLIDEDPRGRYVFPPSRGASRLVSDIAPCQGYERAGRVEYPLNGGVISLENVVDISLLTFGYSTSDDPQSNDDFTQILAVEEGFATHQCFAGPDFAAAGLQAGQNITLQFSYTSATRTQRFYECADLTLVTNATFAAQNIDTQCVNRWSTTKNRRDSVSNPQVYERRLAAEAEYLQVTVKEDEALVQSLAGGSSLTPTEAGVVGAMVTLGTVLIALIIAAFAGFASFGRRQKKGSRGHAASGHVEPVSRVAGH